jgi:hypothetical protein
MSVPPEALIKKELLIYTIQIVLLGLILYHTYTQRKSTVFTAFVSYTIYLSLHISARATQIGYLALSSPDALELFSHIFKAAFFLIMGYAFLNALITDETLKRILRSNTYTAILLLVIVALGIVLLEGKGFGFMGTVKEAVYEIVEVTVMIMIVIILYHSWKDTKAPNLVLVALAFLFFLLADVAHLYSLIWGFSALEYMLRHVLRLSALLVLTYSMLAYKK